MLQSRTTFCLRRGYTPASEASPQVWDPSALLKVSGISHVCIQNKGSTDLKDLVAVGCVRGMHSQHVTKTEGIPQLDILQYKPISRQYLCLI